MKTTQRLRLTGLLIALGMSFAASDAQTSSPSMKIGGTIRGKYEYQTH